MVIPQLPVAVELVLFLATSVQPYPLFISGMAVLETKGILVPQNSGKPVNFTLTDRRFSNDSNALSVGIQIINDEFSVSYGRNIYSRCRMNVSEDTV